MKGWLPRALYWLALLALLSGCWRAANTLTPPSASGERFFSETGHRITQPFLSLYQQIPEPERVLGYPITDAIPLPQGGQRQYFQNLVLEADADGQVHVLTLGEIFYEHDQARATPVPETFRTGCREIAPNTPPVCYLFLRFYERHGGTKVFGLPISPLLQVDGWTVQYFQTARLEFHPEAPPEQQVQVSPLGERFFRYSGEDLALLAPQAGANLPIQPQPLRIQAHSTTLVVPRNQQTPIYITAANTAGRPVQAEVEITLQARTKEGEWQPLPGLMLLTTDSHGTVQWHFTPNQYPELRDKTWVRINLRIHTPTSPASTYLDLRLWPSP